MSHNPFSPAYKSQLDLSDITRSRKLSEANVKSLNERRQSDDPEVRQLAMGTIPGLGKKASAGKETIGQWPKKKPLNQPPINSQAKLQVADPGKQARLSRGRAI
jgi:hypothetical protein